MPSHGQVSEWLRRAAQSRRDGRLQDARTELTEAVAFCRNGSLIAELALSLRELGEVERKLKNPDTAITHYRESISLYRTLPETARLAHTIRHLGDIYSESGQIELAEPCYVEALTLYRSLESVPVLDLANATRSMAVLITSRGGNCSPLWAEAAQLYEIAGVSEGVAECRRRSQGDQ